MSFKELKSVDYLVVHCAYTKPSMDVGVDEIRRWHRQRGWLDVGYHFVIRRDGQVETGRAANEVGAHARGFNHLSLAICLVGGMSETTGKPEANYTDEQMSALRELLEQLREQHPDAEILGHRDLPNVHKACPCFDVRSWWNS